MENTPFSYIDSHCHLDRYENLDPIMHRAHEAHVSHILSISVNRLNAEKVMHIAEQYPSVYAAVGVHPCDVNEDALDDLEQWLLHTAQHPKAIALGETGLDIQPHSPDLQRQHDAFHAHIRAALYTGLPLITHIRNAFSDFFDVWNDWSPQPPLGVLHCFTGTWEQAKAALDMGWYISFSGIVTFKRNGDLAEVAAKVPEDRFLIETDAPWLAPEPYRGNPNEPAYIVHTAQKMAQLRGQSLDQIRRHAYENFFTLFKKALPLS
jgi:TatD DNase family protein